MADRIHTPSTDGLPLRVADAQEAEFLAAVRRLDPFEQEALQRAIERSVAGMPFEASVAAFRREVCALRGGQGA